MAISDEADIDTMLATFGVPVEFIDANSQRWTVNGILEMNDAEAAMLGVNAGIASKIVTLTVRTGTLPGIKEGSSVTVGSSTVYGVTQVRLTDDGALTKLFCF